MKLHSKQLDIGYGHKTIVRKIDLSLLQGELCVLLGKNGSGKSTLLKTMASIIPQLSGDIFLNGKKIEQYGSKEKARLLSVVLTNKIVLPLRVEEILQLGRQAYTGFLDRLSETDIDVIRKIIDALELENFLNQPIQNLSDGEQQKVMIARALVQETPFIILDEPTTHLDLENKAILLKLLKKISREQNKGILFSTHDINMALPIVDKIWILEQASLKQYETPDQIHQAVHALFDSKHLRYDRQTNNFNIICEE